MEDTRQRFQGKCFVGKEGHKYMHYYDNMPPPVRERLKYSRFNICAACLQMGRTIAADDAASLLKRIDSFEEAILNELGSFGLRPPTS